MKKAILILIGSAFILCTSYAQNADFGSSERIKSDKVMNLSADQIAKIKKLNREVGPKFKAIGQSNLPGYEKGRKKKALALEHKAEIRKILTENQMEAWESYYGNMDKDDGLRDIIKDYYDIRLKQLEKNYEKEKDLIEKSQLPKKERKTRLETLKKNYKNEKEQMKKQRDLDIESNVFEK